ncbi:PPC domain-containing DNA-binding protein [Amycolatopsis palatopharyngis]|uniref:PPC domain-containing DNA-binding protein n=1 Tax=Amycolatopsis palatopharyngis TaxID=187982 RepID=UPI000E264E03|nr:PPC domain-containing DNA-binding protein [Amycolatopsis palatopharyngis]
MRSKLLGDGPPRTHVVVLDTGEDVLAELGAFAEAEGLHAASFTAIGAFRSVTLGYFDLDERRYLENPVAEQVEVLTLAGNIVAGEDGRKLHAHGVVGLRDGTTRGGHLLAAVVRPTLEVMVTESPRQVTRRFDESVGLALIDL